MVEDVDEAGADRGEPAVLPDQRTGFTKVGNRWSWNRRTIPLRSSQIDASLRWRRSPTMEKALEEVAGEGAGDGEGAGAEIGREGAGTLKREGGITRWFLFSSSSVLVFEELDSRRLRYGSNVFMAKWDKKYTVMQPIF
ncbi:hypothetical protein LXL04_011959 [Taraxacum kok-saghyz]